MKLNKLLKLDMETAYVPVAKLKDVQEMMSNWRENNRRIRIFSFLTCAASFFSAMNFIYDKETSAAIASFLTLFIFLLSGIFVNANKRFVYLFPVLGVMVFSLAPEHYVDLTIRTFFMITVFLPALISSIFAYKALYNYKNVFIPLSKRKGFPNFVFSTADMYADKIYEKEKDTKTVAEKRVEASFNPFNEQQNVTDEEIARMNSLRYEELKTHNQDIFMGAYYESKEVKHTADEEKTYKYGKSIFGFNFIIPHNEIKGAKKADNREVMWHWNEMKSKMFVGEENWLTYFVIVIMIYMWTTPSVSGFLMFVFLALHILGTNYIKQDKLIGFPLVLCIYLYLTIPSLANYVVIGLFTVFRMPRIIRWLCNLPIYNKLSKEPGFPSFIETTADLYGDQLYIREEPKPVVKRTKIEPIVMDIGYDEEEDKKSFRELRRLSEFNYQEQNKDNGSLREDSSWNAFNYLETDEQNSAYDEFAIYEEINKKRREAEVVEETIKPNKEMGRRKKMKTNVINSLREEIFPIDEVTENCHASTVLPLEDGTVVAAWFGGTKEGNDDVKIYVSVRENGEWAKPYPIHVDGKELPHWNPVLHLRKDNTICLYFKYGKPISDWRTYSCVSRDGGKTFTKPEELTPGEKDGARGPVKNKQIKLSNGTILAPASKEPKHSAWKCFTDISEDDGRTYKHSKFVPGVKKNGKAVKLIQPTLWEDKNGVHMLIRSNAGRIYKSDSADFGETWSKPIETPYPNPNSGIDLIKLEDETIVLCMNPVGADWGNRAPLVLMRSFDGGNTFEEFFKLEDIKGDYEFSYPAITAVGKTLHITYTHERKTIIYWQVEIE